MIGSVQSASKSCPYAWTSVGGSVRKPIATNQCAKPTMPQRFIRLWPRNSRTRVSVRAFGSSVRLPAGTGCPSFTKR